jgi:hypothetical protein
LSPIIIAQQYELTVLDDNGQRKKLENNLVLQVTVQAMSKGTRRKVSEQIFHWGKIYNCFFSEVLGPPFILLQILDYVS